MFKSHKSTSTLDVRFVWRAWCVFAFLIAAIFSSAEVKAAEHLKIGDITYVAIGPLDVVIVKEGESVIQNRRSCQLPHNKNLFYEVTECISERKKRNIGGKWVPEGGTLNNDFYPTSAGWFLLALILFLCAVTFFGFLGRLSAGRRYQHEP